MRAFPLIPSDEQDSPFLDEVELAGIVNDDVTTHKIIVHRHLDPHIFHLIPHGLVRQSGRLMRVVHAKELEIDNVREIILVLDLPSSEQYAFRFDVHEANKKVLLKRFAQENRLKFKNVEYK